MQFKQKLVYIALGCALLLSCDTDKPSDTETSSNTTTQHAQIVFSSNRDEKRGTPNPEIYVMDFNGKNLRRLTNDFTTDHAPGWFDPAFTYFD